MEDIMVGVLAVPVEGSGVLGVGLEDIMGGMGGMGGIMVGEGEGASGVGGEGGGRFFGLVWVGVVQGILVWLLWGWELELLLFGSVD
ncbi:hypothetical protein BO78DRAFT_417297 [Aspergillus sclerotiicarbonarius CBS 121057]|uniref:Uncharacterized protein n=1 Tax=Aspergillus sclerotiicarbonarius (strain CBS 121057 / IBT 28362) TaxID=1448318 RepID=A0A319EM05_ASPSB|nr:hypothetical protein BO78DRAFT_417297 [Aspergillus sclerotiicarbonarius CBS 121057]